MNRAATGAAASTAAPDQRRSSRVADAKIEYMDDSDLIHEVHEQLDWHWRGQARPRLEGLTDAELLWEPAPGTWSVRRPEEPAPASATYRAGTGDCGARS